MGAIIIALLCCLMYTSPHTHYIGQIVDSHGLLERSLDLGSEICIVILVELLY